MIGGLVCVLTILGALVLVLYRYRGRLKKVGEPEVIMYGSPQVQDMTEQFITRPLRYPEETEDTQGTARRAQEAELLMPSPNVEHR